VPKATVRRGRAFAPAHVSGAFSPRLEARDPRARGSIGAGVVLDVGVTATATWSPGRRSVSVTAEVPGPLPISTTVAEHLLSVRPGHLEVHLQHRLPVGQGFGSSAAGALSTGLAVAAALGLPRSKAVEVAHLADLYGGGGLGGVAAALGGGLEVRVRAGIPPWGRVERRAVDAHLLVATLGAPIPSPRVLRDRRLSARFEAAEALLTELGARPSWERFWDVAERFTDRVGLADRALRDALRGLRRRRARAAQAMFGRSLFALPPPGPRGEEVRRWLAGRANGLWELQVASRGARRLPTLRGP
jgi:pantoate kinase